MDPPRTSFVIISLVLANLLTPGVSDNTNLLGCLSDQFNRSNMSTTGVVFTPSDPSFAFLQQYENLRATSASPRKPLLIVAPFNEPQIRAAIYCSRKHDIQIRPRSGGHDYEGLSYTSSDPFVIVDFRNFRSITIDENQKTAWVQTGATLGELHHAVGKVSKTLAVVVGVCPTVGAGGHISGGGYGMLSRKHGLASDRVIDAKLMNADGEILDRKSMGDDVFWSLRGGGSMSFGVILAFKLSLVDVPMTVTAFDILRSSEENVTRLLQRYQLVADKVDENLLLRLTLHSAEATNDGNRTITAYFTALYLGRANDLMILMKREFPELGLLKSECNEMSWIDSVLFFANLRNRTQDALLNRAPQPPFTPSFYKGKSDFLRARIPSNGFPGIWRALHEEAANQGALEFSAFGGALSKYSETESPFAHRAGVRFMIRYGVVWDKDGDGELQKHMGWIRRLYSYMTTYVTSSPREAYFNYKDLDIGRNSERGNTSYEQAKVWGQKYYKRNFDRLVRAKTRVDPSNYFRNEQSIPIKTLNAG